MNRLKVIYALVQVLVANQSFLSLNDLTKDVENILINEHKQWNLEIKPKRIKNYLGEIDRDFGYNIETRRGPDGGYRLSESGRDSIKELIGLSLDKHERNALNDAFEIAMRAQTFHYNSDLRSARTKLYDKKDLKDQDFEYYIGVANYNKNTTNTIKILKEAMVNHNWVRLASKHEYYGIEKGTEEFKPLYIIHDSDESFVVLKNKKSEYLYQNVLNIVGIYKMEKEFILSYDENIAMHRDEKSLSFKRKVELNFTVITEIGRSVMDLWNYEYDVIANEGNYYEILFHEVYKAYEFLYRMQPNIKGLKIHGEYKKKFKESWNNNLDSLEKI